MARKAEETEGYSVTFQIRVTQSMKKTIDRNAEAAGMKSSAWVRRALQFAIDNMGEEGCAPAGAGMSKDALLNLIENDSDIAEAVARAAAEKTHLYSIRDALESYYLNARKAFSRNEDTADGRMLDLIWNILESFPAAEVNDNVSRFYGEELCGTLVWDKIKWGISGYPADRTGIEDFFCMEYESGDSVWGLYFWNGTEKPDLKNIAPDLNEDQINIYHATLDVSGMENFTQENADYLVNLIRQLAAKTSETNLGETRGFLSGEWYAAHIRNINRSFCYIPESFSVEWSSENMRTGQYKNMSEEEIRKILENGEDDTLQPVFTIWDEDDTVVTDENGFWQDETE